MYMYIHIRTGAQGLSHLYKRGICSSVLVRLPELPDDRPQLCEPMVAPRGVPNQQLDVVHAWRAASSCHHYDT